MVVFFAGFAIATLETVYISNMNHTADKSFISAIGSVGNLSMAVYVSGPGLPATMC